MIDDPRQSFEPDVNVLQAHGHPDASSEFSGNGGVAVATEPVVLIAGDLVAESRFVRA